MIGLDDEGFLREYAYDADYNRYEQTKTGVSFKGNLIYPHVVGSSVGLPGIWVLVAVTIGGNLFGIMGMLTFIPISSVCYALLRTYVNRKVEEKEIDKGKFKG